MRPNKEQTLTVLSASFLICATLLFINGYWTIALLAVLASLIPAWACFKVMRRLDRLDRLF